MSDFNYNDDTTKKLANLYTKVLDGLGEDI